MVTRNRAVSTVADVTLALLLVSAAVVTMGVFLTEEEATTEPLRADRAVETVAGMTLEVGYDIRDVRDSPYDIDWPDADGGTYRRIQHGTAAELLATAAVANATFDGDRVTKTGEIFEAAVDGAFRTRITGMETNVHVTAVWRPYKRSSIRGIATAGPRPPEDADVTTATMTVSSGITLSTAPRKLHQATHRNRSILLAAAVVDQQFPIEQTFHSLESQGLRRKLTVNRYYNFLDVTCAGQPYDHEDDDSPLSRESADPWAVNKALIWECPSSVGEQMVPEQQDFATEEAFREWLTIEDVEIIVKTWNA